MNWLNDREYHVDPPTVPRLPSHRALPVRRRWLAPALTAAGVFCVVTLVVVAFSSTPSAPPEPVSAAAGVARTSAGPAPTTPPTSAYVGLEVDEDGPRRTTRGCTP